MSGWLIFGLGLAIGGVGGFLVGLLLFAQQTHSGRW